MLTKILVVEDEPHLLMLAVDVVEEAGFEAVEARDADEAIRLLEEVKGIRLLWTDIDMPGSMNGLLLAATVRDRWPPVEIIVVSGKTSPEPTELPDRGVFFSKPCDRGRIVEALHRMAA